ncbi:hypothetical protein AMTRI_Chr01g113620 [Amborella trichopoda]
MASISSSPNFSGQTLILNSLTAWSFFFPFTFPSSFFLSLSQGLLITFSSRIMRILFEKTSFNLGITANLEMEWNIRFWALLYGILCPLIVYVHGGTDAPDGKH